jgi:hypothetical protein
MTPLAVLFAGFFYSLWTNSSYKAPLAVSGLIVLCGNVLYFIAYDLGSVVVLFMGRFLIGMGGARVINRRYIADYTSMRLRT